MQSRVSSEIDAAPQQIAQGIVGLTDATRDDRLWPCDPIVFSTNSVGVAYGGWGIAYFLDQCLGAVPDPAMAWLRSRSLSVNEQPPGLYVGLAGVALAQCAVGLTNDAESVMRLVRQSRLRFSDPSMMFGAAGWGFASLAMFEATGDQEYVADAVEAADFLLRTAEREGDSLRWRSRDGLQHVGFGYGSAGIALFLMQAGLVSNRADYTSAARDAFKHVMEACLPTPAGIGWKDTTDATITAPSLLRGGAGIGCTAVRFAANLGDPEYFALCDDIARSLRVRVGLMPGLFDGLAGVGEFFLDLFTLTGESECSSAAQALGDAVLLFGVETPEGLAFPGASLDRISADWGTGAAGVGAFLLRLKKGGPRPFIDTTFLRPDGPGAMSSLRPRAQASAQLQSTNALVGQQLSRAQPASGVSQRS